MYCNAATAVAIVNMHRKFGNIWFLRYAHAQTDIQMHSAQYSAFN